MAESKTLGVNDGIEDALGTKSDGTVEESVIITTTNAASEAVTITSTDAAYIEMAKKIKDKGYLNSDDHEVKVSWDDNNKLTALSYKETKR